jgi:hypothetical protein
MPNFYVARFVIVVPALAALGVVAAGAGSSESATAAAPLTCEIEVHQAAGGVELQALVSTTRDTSGSYRLSVAKSGGGGSANIKQSGGFDVRGGNSRVVSSVILGGDGRYTARLSLTAEGRTVECARRIGGAL